VDGKGPGRLVTITAREADAARSNAADSVPRGVAASIVGATVSDVRRLAAAGLLRSTRSGPKSSRNQVRFSRRRLASFVDRLHASVTEVYPAGPDMCDIPTAGLRSGRSLAAITSMVMRGQLRHVTRAVGGHGFRTLRVDMNEIRAAAEHDRNAQRTIDEVARELRVTRFTALALVKEGHLAATSARSPLSRRKVLVVDRSVLAAFASNYVSLSTLAERREIRSGVLKGQLDAAGAVPAFPSGRMRSVVYRTSDLEGAHPRTTTSVHPPRQKITARRRIPRAPTPDVASLSSSSGDRTPRQKKS